MSTNDILEAMDDDERALYLSAQNVKGSRFWNHLLNELDKEALDANQTLLTKTMEGDEKKAIIAACKLQAIGWVISTMEETLNVSIHAPDQEQEE